MTHSVTLLYLLNLQDCFLSNQSRYTGFSFLSLTLNVAGDSLYANLGRA